MGVRPVSSLERNLVLPVDALRRLVLRCRMMMPEVSLMVMSDMMKKAPPWLH